MVRTWSGSPHADLVQLIPVPAIEFTTPFRDRAHERKPGIAFEEASTAFHDDSALLYDDPDHAGDEDRFLLLGVSARLRVLVVVHCYRDDDEVIRIISARSATPRERGVYGSQGSRP